MNRCRSSHKIKKNILSYFINSYNYIPYNYKIDIRTHIQANREMKSIVTDKDENENENENKQFFFIPKFKKKQIPRKCTEKWRGIIPDFSKEPLITTTTTTEKIISNSDLTYLERHWEKIIHHNNHHTNLEDQGQQEKDQLFRIIHSEILRKIHSYYQQDRKKNRLDRIQLSCEEVLTKLIESQLLCYYCKNPVLFLYKHRYDPAQWTFERIDNRFSHTVNNIVVACLKCNIKRRNQNSRRFAESKKYKIVVMLEDEDSMVIENQTDILL